MQAMEAEANTDRAAGPRQHVFVIGSPRSGTTWLHRMLAEHPLVAAIPEELTVFSRYLAPVVRGFERERGKLESGAWRQGLPLLYTPAEFEQGLTRIVEAIYARVLARRPGATHIMDKHPGYSLHLPLIERLVPGARYVHIIRDGRDVAVSMISARRRVGFGAGEVEGAAREWHACTTQAMAFGQRVGDRYVEVRYEELFADTERVLADVMRRVGLPAEQQLVARIAADYHIDKRQVSRGDTEVNRLRAQAGAIWSTRLSARERFIFQRVAGPLLERLGYARPGWWRTAHWQVVIAIAYPLYLRIKRTLAALRGIWLGPAIRPEP